MKKKISHILIIAYIILAVFITVCLLSYNEYDVTEFGNKTLIVVDEDTSSGYKSGDLIIAKKEKNVHEKDEVFYYVLVGKRYFIRSGIVTDEAAATMIVDQEILDKKFVIGKCKDAISFPFLGKILSILESKWGYLVIIILPILVAFIYEIYSILREFKKEK